MRDKINVVINIKNTTDKNLTFYSDQGCRYWQLAANMFLTDGEVQGGIKQKGVFEFSAPDEKMMLIKSKK
ncbi:hypothetical protein AB0857_18295 [Bacillus velezensis]|uniref:hypothetical protein n=1 Tax=Bacillus TaxID=1386 RepID=UPI0009C6D087|nr:MULTISPECIES: hypothetical protein [Bacillus]SLC10784.1 Uncharacterised protein [Mycobacteroides abscessus subsp. massiliense]MEB3424308.1 hypothetical protein [Bacillus velezensis]MEC1899294.1 hypothetical protein [Bacillus velezensis]MEC1917340.1 hypothetical protein [Bacillus velezensis]UMR26939.1 hypothetical protein MK616_03170 [Bacillus amyloliquefaciens]